MQRTHAPHLRPLVAAIGIAICTLAGAGNDTLGEPALSSDPAIHNAPRGDTPHDTFAAASIPTLPKPPPIRCDHIA